MSKSLFIVTTSLAVFLSLSTVAFAQDFDGFAPETTPPTTTTPEPALMVDRTQLLAGLKTDEQTKLQSQREKYTAGLQMQSDPSVQPNASSYKLAAIMVSARHHKTLEAYINYLQNIDIVNQGSGVNSGMQPAITEADLNSASQEMVKIATLINDYDATVDAFSGSMDTELATSAPLLRAKSAAITAQLLATKATLSKLVTQLQ